MLCGAAPLEKKQYHVPEIINHPYHHHQLTSSNSSSGRLLLVMVWVAVVVVAADCGGGGDRHMSFVVLVIVVKLYPVRTWYQVIGLCADTHRLILKAISQGFAFHKYRIDRVHSLEQTQAKKNPTLHSPFSRPASWYIEIK